MATVAVASAALCCQPKERNKLQKAGDSKIALDEKVKSDVVSLPNPVPPTLNPTPPLVLKVDPTGISPKSLRFRTSSTKSNDDKKNKNVSKKTLGLKPVPQDIFNGNVDVPKLIGVFDPSKASTVEPMDVIAAKRNRISKINWDEYDSKSGKK